MQRRFPQCASYSRAVVLIAAALPAGALHAQTVLSTSYVTPAARTEQAALCPAGIGFPAQWTWDPAQTLAKPRAATTADNLTPRIEQYRAGRLIAVWPSLGSNPATCDFGNPDATHPVNLTAAAASGCGPFGNYSHVDLWNIMEDGDQFLVAPAVYTGPTNNIVLSDKPRYWTGPMNKPTNIVIRGVTKNGVRPLIYRNDGGQGDYATAQGAVYFASATNVTMQNIDIAAGPNGSVGKAGIYINTAANLTLQDMRIHEFAWQANGADGQNGVFSTENVTGFITLSQIEAFNNGGPNGPTHNFYMNKSATDSNFIVRLLNSWTHDAVYGHTFKSRAQRNLVVGNYFQGGLPNVAHGQTQAENYLLDMPNGGRASVIDNIFVKNASGPNSNAMSVTFAMEGIIDTRPQALVIRNNTFVALARDYDGFHQIYPLSFFYPNIVPGTGQWPASIAYSIRNNAFIGYCPTSTMYLSSGNYRGDLALSAAFGEINLDYALKQKFVPANDTAIVNWGAYKHVAQPGAKRAAATIGARD